MIVVTEGWQEPTDKWTGGIFPELEDSYDWPYVIAYAQFAVIEIEKVLTFVEGENDTADWILVAKLKDGRYGAVIAGCDYTGWG